MKLFRSHDPESQMIPEQHPVKATRLVTGLQIAADMLLLNLYMGAADRIL